MLIPQGPFPTGLLSLRRLTLFLLLPPWSHMYTTSSSSHDSLFLTPSQWIALTLKCVVESQSYLFQELLVHYLQRVHGVLSKEKASEENTTLARGYMIILSAIASSEIPNEALSASVVSHLVQFATLGLKSGATVFDEFNIVFSC